MFLLTHSTTKSGAPNHHKEVLCLTTHPASLSVAILPYRKICETVMQIVFLRLKVCDQRLCHLQGIEIYRLLKA